MPSIQNSEIVSYRGGGGGGPGGALARRGAAEEEWVTKKKVEITTTKNVERKIHRQLVLEDGRVVEEELPTVTVDTTEDKQTFETDQVGKLPSLYHIHDIMTMITFTIFIRLAGFTKHLFQGVGINVNYKPLSSANLQFEAFS